MNESKRKKEHMVSFLNNLFSVISRCRYSKSMPPQERLFHVAVLLMPKYRNGSESVYCPLSHICIVKRTCRYCCLWMSPVFLVPLSILQILADLLRSGSMPWCREGDGERCFRWYVAECLCCWWVFYVYPRVPPSYAGGWIWRCLRCLWCLCSASFLSFCCMKKADPVSSKCLYRCLRVLDVFVHLYYNKKDVFCQDFYEVCCIYYRVMHNTLREVATFSWIFRVICWKIQVFVL